MTAAAVFVLASAAPVSAQLPPPGQSDKTGDPRKDARVHFGPVHFTPTLVIERLGIDTNVFNEAGEQQSDFTATATPAVVFWVPAAHRALVTSTIASRFTYYHDFPTQRSIDPSVNVQGELYLRRLTLAAEGSFSRSKQRPNFEIDARVEQRGHSASVGFSYRILSKTEIGLVGSRGTTQFSGDAAFLGTNLAERLNRDQEGLRLTVRQRLTSLTGLTLVAESRRDRFVLSPNRSADGFKVAPGFEFRAKAIVSGSAEVGYRHFEPNDPDVAPFDGLVARLSLARQIRGTTALSVQWDRDVQFSYQAVNPYYIENAIRVNIRRQLAGRFDGIAGADRRDLSYVQRLSRDEGSPGSVTTTYSLDVGYRVNRETRLGVGVSWARRRSNPSSRNYDGLRAGLSLSYGF